MPDIKWIHISDIHIKSDDECLEKYNSDVVLDALWKDIEIRSKLDNKLENLDFAFITGDLAYSGREYEEVYERIILPLSQKAKIDIDHIYIVPGNHDIIRDVIDDDTKKIEARLDNNDRIAELFVDPSFSIDKIKIFSRQNNYKQFVENKLNHIPLTDSYVYKTSVPITDNFSLNIVGLNSSWLAHGDIVDKKKLVLGEPLIRELYNSSMVDELTISLTHHPLKASTEWFKDIENNTINQILAKSDFVLSGHVHSGNIASLITPQGSYIELVGGSIFEERKWKSNSYNYVVFNTDKLQGNVYVRRYYDESATGPLFTADLPGTGTDSGILPICLQKENPVQSDGGFFESEFNEFINKQERELINRPLLSETYEARDSIASIFPDIYVDPYIKPQKNPTGTSIKLSEWMNVYYNKNMKVLILGHAGTGKTTSLISIHNVYKKNFIVNRDKTIPFFYEARNYRWESKLKVEHIISNAKNRYELSGEAAKKILDGKFQPIILIDAMDEAFPSAYQESGHLDKHNLFISFPHIVTCRIDFFERNLSDETFCSQYDEILLLEAWELDREVTEFLQNYFNKYFGEEDNSGKVFEIKKYLHSNFPIIPLSVTAFLFLWQDDSKSIVSNPITSFATLLERFAVFWAKREVNKVDSNFKDFNELLKAYEIVSWEILKNHKRPFAFRHIARKIAIYTKKAPENIEKDRGLLSILRLLPDHFDNKTLSVISFSHEALFEYFIAKKLIKALRDDKQEQGILDQMLGHSINRLARELLESLADYEQNELIKSLKKRYHKLLRRKNAIIHRLIHKVKVICSKSEEIKSHMNRSIIRRHIITYFWGRIEANKGGQLIAELFDKLFSGDIDDHEIVKSTVGSSILFLDNEDREKVYLSSISDGSLNDICNRVYHLVYYGDASYVDLGTFLQDDKSNWNKTKQALIQRMASNDDRDQKLRSLDLVTFRRLCETKDIFELTKEEENIILKCVENLTINEAKIEIINAEHQKLLNYIFSQIQDKLI